MTASSAHKQITTVIAGVFLLLAVVAGALVGKVVTPDNRASATTREQAPACALCGEGTVGGENPQKVADPSGLVGSGRVSGSTGR